MVRSASFKNPYNALLHTLNGNTLWEHEAGTTRVTLEPASPKSWSSTNDTQGIKASRVLGVFWEKSLSRRADPASVDGLVFLWFLHSQTGRDLPWDRPQEVLKWMQWPPRRSKARSGTWKTLAPPAGPGPHCLSHHRSTFNKPPTLEFTQSCSYSTKGSSVSGNSKSLQNNLLMGLR